MKMKTMRSNITLQSFAALVVAATSVLAQPNNISMSFETEAVRATGVSPHGRVVVFSISRVPQIFETHVLSFDRLVSDDDGDGVVSIEVDRPIAKKSIWAVVDVESSAYWIGTPGDYPRREVSLAGVVRHDNNGQLRKLEVSRTAADFLLVRPGEGAWLLKSREGGLGDEDQKSNGRLTTSLALLTPLGSALPPPKQFRNGDVLVMIDHYRMEFAVTTVGN